MTDSIQYLPQVDSTNAWARAHWDEFGPIGAVYATSQTAGRGRLGRAWVNAADQALYYTVVLKMPLAQPEALPLLASLAVRDALRLQYGVETAIKWPNDLLLQGKKVAGILCEGVQRPTGEMGYMVGIGLNLCQPQSYFDEADLPHGTSLALQGAAVDAAEDARRLAEYLTDFGFDRAICTGFGREGFAPYRDVYKAACINLGRSVTFDGGSGIATDIDENGHLLVQTSAGENRVFTGEVSVKGIYGQV